MEGNLGGKKVQGRRGTIDDKKETKEGRFKAKGGAKERRRKG